MQRKTRNVDLTHNIYIETQEVGNPTGYYNQLISVWMWREARVTRAQVISSFPATFRHSKDAIMRQSRCGCCSVVWPGPASLAAASLTRCQMLTGCFMLQHVVTITRLVFNYKYLDCVDTTRFKCSTSERGGCLDGWSPPPTKRRRETRPQGDTGLACGVELL